MSTPADLPALVEPEWLAERLEMPDLRVADCTLHLRFDPATGDRHSRSGRTDWLAGHIPGSQFADILGPFSAEEPRVPYERPGPDRFAEALASIGVGSDDRLVLYDAAGNRWAARVYWLCRSFGFDRVGILHGGWRAWTRAGLPIQKGDTSAPDTTPPPLDPRPDVFVDADTVQAAIDDDDTRLLNALDPVQFRGEGVVRYGRPGHIPTSRNVPAFHDDGVVDPANHRYRPLPELRRRFDAVGAFDADRVITYCGGGIAAASLAFALTLVGIDNVAIYDGSLAEWGRSDRPLVCGEPE